jgi:hypothetical protein
MVQEILVVVGEVDLGLVLTHSKEVLVVPVLSSSDIKSHNLQQPQKQLVV